MCWALLAYPLHLYSVELQHLEPAVQPVSEAQPDPSARAPQAHRAAFRFLTDKPLSRSEVPHFVAIGTVGLNWETDDQSYTADWNG
jgi:hypothetical protein